MSISGYHIAERANPITQLALTLANGFTHVEYYRSRGMDINVFISNLSFLSPTPDPNPRSRLVVRRIWAVQGHTHAAPTSAAETCTTRRGRSLHAQEIDFNDIRTTLQALLAIQDNANLHTNASTRPSPPSTNNCVRVNIADRQQGERRDRTLLNQCGRLHRTKLHLDVKKPLCN